MTTPKLFDPIAVAQHRSRVRGDDMARFLQDEAITEIRERLGMVNKRFKRMAIVTGWPEIWGPAWPDARIVPDNNTLDLQEEAHDLIVHGLSLHWSNDPVGQLIQCRRALRPDGLFLAVLFGGQTLHELRAVLAEAETEIRGGLSPRVSPMAEIRDLGHLLQRAGLALPVADCQKLTASYASAFHLMRDLRQMGETNALSQRPKGFTPRRLLFEMAQRYATAFADADGRIAATYELIYLSGWAPDDSQPKPLRPGSATTRLADVLGQIDPKQGATD